MIRQKRNVCRAKCLVLSLDVREMERRGRAELPGRRGEGVTVKRVERETNEVGLKKSYLFFLMRRE